MKWIFILATSVFLSFSAFGKDGAASTTRKPSAASGVSEQVLSVGPNVKTVSCGGQFTFNATRSAEPGSIKIVRVSNSIAIVYEIYKNDNFVGSCSQLDVGY